MHMETIGKIFQKQGQMRRCLVCEGLFSRDEAAAHATVHCQPHAEPTELVIITHAVRNADQFAKA